MIKQKLQQISWGKHVFEDKHTIFRWFERYMIFYLRIKYLFPRLASRAEHKATWQRRNITQTSVILRC